MPPVSASSGMTDAVQAARTVTAAWQSDILPTLKPMARALFSAGRFLGEREGRPWLLVCPTRPIGPAVSSIMAMSKPRSLNARLAPTSAWSWSLTAPPAQDDSLAPVDSLATWCHHVRRLGRRMNAKTRPQREEPKDEDIDLNDLIDVPPESLVSPLDRLEQAFPGSKLIEENLT